MIACNAYFTGAICTSGSYGKGGNFLNLANFMLNSLTRFYHTGLLNLDQFACDVPKLVGSAFTQCNSGQVLESEAKS